MPGRHSGDQVHKVKQTAAPSFLYFTGNEIGALFGAWAWKTYKEANPSADFSKACMLSSTVSSMILQTMAQTEGFYFEDTLTGFKWMGNRARELQKDGHVAYLAIAAFAVFLNRRGSTG